MNRIQAMQMFVTLAEELSFNKAASRHGMARSSMVMIVLRLEQQLAFPLIDRSARKLKLTEKGASYYRLCKQTLGLQSATDDTSRSMSIANVRRLFDYNRR